MTETPIPEVPNRSILDTVKKSLGLDSAYDAFDSDILLHINGVFFTLNQLGVGPIDGFSIDDNSITWDDYLGSTDKNLSVVKQYVFLRVKLLFDPPTTSFAIDAIKKQIDELEWRLNVYVETRKNLLSADPTNI